METITQHISMGNSENENYNYLDFISAQQNIELKNRLERIKNNETNFISLDNFKQKYKD